MDNRPRQGPEHVATGGARQRGTRGKSGKTIPPRLASATDSWPDAEHPFLCGEEKTGLEDEPGRHVDVVNRHDGRPRQAICTTDADEIPVLVTNTEVIDLSMDLGGDAYSHITTNAENTTDVFAVVGDSSADDTWLYHLDP